MMRPSVSGPTGISIGAPVSVTSCPRTMPSVLSMAMQRTVRSPSSCATSRTSMRPFTVVCSAFMMNGRSPSNCTSTTAPRTWVTRPTMLLAPAAGRGATVVDMACSCSLVARPSQSASAPEIISISSLVMLAWRARL
jgi:hypothetical protein